jgi:DNA-binding PadR family transcriptional regulator
MAAAESSLARSTFLILLALADQPRHGLGIIDEIDARTNGDVRMGPGTLYGTLQRLVDNGLIRETPHAPDPSDDDPRRRYYQITPRGTRELRSEAARMQALVQTAVHKNVLGKA